MKTIVGVRLKKIGKVYYFDPGTWKLNIGDSVIVETSLGEEFAEVVIANKEVSENRIVSPLKPIKRIATYKDKKHYEENKKKEKEAFGIAIKNIKKHKLDMNLINVEYKFDNSKILFYFTADGRIDFRELVKDLAAIFKTRIELRQIGIRDEIKRMIEDRGGNTSSSVSSKTDVVIVGDEPGKKYDDALRFGITIWRESELKEFIDE